METPSLITRRGVNYKLATFRPKEKVDSNGFTLLYLCLMFHREKEWRTFYDGYSFLFWLCLSLLCLELFFLTISKPVERRPHELYWRFRSEEPLYSYIKKGNRVRSKSTKRWWVLVFSGLISVVDIRQTMSVTGKWSTIRVSQEEL